MSGEHHAKDAKEHLQFLGLVKGGTAITACVCAGLFACRWLNEFLPDALGIGLSMFAAGYAAGLLTGQKRVLSRLVKDRHGSE